ncbi:MAG: hypothetical protein CMJ39_08330 [Phycisphaerae bacterium]|nr:hypothetical protein [Phycisphaerae bacterium]|tara:strand:- start:1909 stop:2151 length:243 start_codon:yes stop_codon:yes gene_type:complete
MTDSGLENSGLWFRASLVLVVPITVLAILGGTGDEQGTSHGIMLWLLLGLVALMGFCLVVGWIRRGDRGSGVQPDENGVV